MEIEYHIEMLKGYRSDNQWEQSLHTIYNKDAAEKIFEQVKKDSYQTYRLVKIIREVIHE